MKIYTGKGDDGSTSLWYGGRVSKASLRTEAYGAVDEAVSALGLARAACEDKQLAQDILDLQRDLFTASAQLATAPQAAERLQEGVSKVGERVVERIEQSIDGYLSKVDLPDMFVVPGGTDLSAKLDLARATLRRAERRVVALNEEEKVDATLIAFFNRANDLLFAMARYADEQRPELFEGRSSASR